MRTSILDLLGMRTLTPEAVRGVRSADPGPRSLPLGLAPDGSTLRLSLATHPHVLVHGATGTGKSELLQTLLTALALRHDPARLQLLLASFKDDQAFGALRGLPHVAGRALPLATLDDLVRRFCAVLDGELRRRRGILAAAEVTDRQAYGEVQRRYGSGLAPLPALVVALDDLDELITAGGPPLVELLAEIGRDGAALGVHLLAAVHRWDDRGRRALGPHVAARIVLRLFSAPESQALLGDARAVELPACGHGYLLTAGAPARGLQVATSFEPSVLGTGEVTGTAAAVTRLLADLDAPAVPRWLPPLPVDRAPVTHRLADVLGAPVVDPRRGLTSVNTALHGRGTVPYALVDRPGDHRQDVDWLTLDERGGVAVAGLPGSGTTTTLLSLVCGLAYLHTPDELSVYAVDADQGLRPLAGLPHVRGVVHVSDAGSVRRLVTDVANALAARENGAPPGVAPGRVLLVVDGWAALGAAVPDLAPVVEGIVADGPPHGVHVLLGTPAWTDLRDDVRQAFGTLLQLGTSVHDVSMAPRAAGPVPGGSPGRGVDVADNHFRVLYPAVCPPHPDPAGFAAAAAEVWARLSGAPGHPR